MKNLGYNTQQLILFVSALLAPYTAYATDKKFIILTASYNNIEYYKWNLDSVFDQTYKNWELVYVDDVSNDGTGEAVSAYIKERGFEDKVRFVGNTEKCYCLKNYYREIHKIPDDHIIVTLDGDDAFAKKNVLEYLNKVYQDPHIWYTYGNFEYYPEGATIGNPITLKPFPRDVVEDNDFRDYPWNIHHLRSFYAGLFKRIKLEDLFYEGQFLPTAEDLAFMFPIIEQAGKHHKFIERVLYLHNIGNPLITVRTWPKDFRKNIKHYICNKEEYEPLTKPPYTINKERSLKADVLIFNEHGSEQLSTCLANMKKLRSLATIFVMQDDPNSADKNYAAIKAAHPDIIFIDGHEKNPLDAFFGQAKEPFTLVMSDLGYTQPAMRLSTIMRHMEKKGVYMAYLRPFKRFLSNKTEPVVHLEEHLSAFQFGHFKSRPASFEFFALYRTTQLKKRCKGRSYTRVSKIKEHLEDVDPHKVALVIS